MLVSLFVSVQKGYGSSLVIPNIVSPSRKPFEQSLLPVRASLDVWTMKSAQSSPAAT